AAATATTLATVAVATTATTATRTTALGLLLATFDSGGCARLGLDFVFVSHDQNSSPASRAASASALTRPWNRKPPRSNTTLVTPAAVAASATRLPTSVAAATFEPAVPRTSFSRVEAEATVVPAASSITWA